MNRKQFFEKVKNSGITGKEDLVKIQRAYWLAKLVHKVQKRDSGERYFEHCRRVSVTLLKYNTATADEIVIALLHDCIEDGFIPKDVLEMLFGSYVAYAVEKLSKVTIYFDEIGMVEKIRKDTADYYATISKSDAHIRKIKISDRSDNLQDISAWSEDRKFAYFEETKRYILPIAEILIKDQLIAEFGKKGGG